MVDSGDKKRPDEPKRSPGATGGSPAVGEGEDIAFAGMVGIAVVSAVIISMLALGGFFNLGVPATSSSGSADKAEAAEDEPIEDEEAAPSTTEAPTTTEAPATTEAPIEVEPASALVEAGADGIVLSGSVPDQATADALLAQAATVYSADQITNELEIVDGAAPYTLNIRGELTDGAQLDSVRSAFVGASTADETGDELVLAEPDGAAAFVDASQASIVLSGTVPDQATADALLAQAATVYSADQITNELEIVEGASPYTLSIRGEVTDGVLFDAVRGAFSADALGEVAQGADADDSGFFLADSSDAEAALNALDGVLFQSGTAVILDESLPTLDAAADIMTGNADLAFEVGGHTDSRGGDESNQALSEARAAAVVQALRDRGVANDLTPRGFGETRLLITPDDTAEDQQANRRIEFRVI